MEYTSFPPFLDDDSGLLLTPISIPLLSTVLDTSTDQTSAENDPLYQPPKLVEYGSSEDDDDQARLVISSISFTTIFGDQPKSTSSQSEPIDIVVSTLPETSASFNRPSRIASTTSSLLPSPSSVSSVWRPFQDEEDDQVRRVISSIYFFFNLRRSI
jgi:hypothetical protein